VDATGALSYLVFGSVYEPSTIVEDISAVPAGHVVTVAKGRMRSREYWSPLRAVAGQGAETLDLGVTVEGLSEILRDAVLSHLVDDVPVGVFLSGGIDSSSLVAVMSHAGVRATTFSLVFREEEFNEAQHSREIARRFGTEHHEILVSQDDTPAIMPEALHAMDQPTMDGINTYLVSAKARAAGVKVALTGLGADEMFAGYSNFRRVPKMERVAARLAKPPAPTRRVAETQLRVRLCDGRHATGVQSVAGDAAVAGQGHAPRFAGTLGGCFADLVADLDRGTGAHGTGMHIASDTWARPPRTRRDSYPARGRVTKNHFCHGLLAKCLSPKGRAFCHL
jgi:asparagine synthase (glutamine-hydrolysing)